MTALPDFGAVLRRAAEEKGLDLEQLARKSGLSETRVALALASSGKTTTHELVHLALMLGVKLEFSFKKEEPPVTPKGFSSSRSISRSWHGGSVCSISRTRALRWEQSFSDTGEGWARRSARSRSGIGEGVAFYRSVSRSSGSTTRSDSDSGAGGGWT